eukprot:CAMPEP_0178913864 /NCGR_PEP_ID=MMETSP0786-20121207/11085_1 /TAXON_ID=186022 /ORGANISM="Thalassionema frauenfeldii, Strain CCMP 1798" /LENGTH=184 /DNA_ID=CAMNT_0020586665 /DNA_START=460 /DNA_END=1014 /DNA_ORIENTATION=+
MAENKMQAGPDFRACPKFAVTPIEAKNNRYAKLATSGAACCIQYQYLFLLVFVNLPVATPKSAIAPQAVPGIKGFNTLSIRLETFATTHAIANTEHVETTFIGIVLPSSCSSTSTMAVEFAGICVSSISSSLNNFNNRGLFIAEFKNKKYRAIIISSAPAIALSNELLMDKILAVEKKLIEPPT